MHDYLGNTMATSCHSMNRLKSSAATEAEAEDLIIVGDSRLAIHRKDSLLSLLKYHWELTMKLKSVKYLHVVREYNATADSPTGKIHESKVSMVILNDHRKLELKEINRIQEVMYERSSVEHQTAQEGFASILQLMDGEIRHQLTVADFFHPIRAEISAMSRKQTTKNNKRVKRVHVDVN
ncbi:LOW QUALITY PROTEIN: hypothetical protein PHMEG_00029826 [Phytophthora megakarya]|uniref:RNase H type-1 domain-containing protein n=1 Tax=Phytophthora megakarya TaxID=4795 RepID=A0A225V1H3_9STRA|nr:LOW QUALITY PROTEIN: hypothetical protein PHMEG_00029826 [Phytophthora megakarya]